VPIMTPKDGAFVSSPFETTGSVDPAETVVSAVVESKTTSQRFNGEPESMQGSDWLFTFDVDPDEYWLIVTEGEKPQQISITVQ
jgi:hypothetical protein